MFTISNKTTIAELEKNYPLIDDSHDIIIVNSVAPDELGIVPAIIQFCATWFNRTKTARLIIDFESLEESIKIYSLEYVYPIVIYCWKRNIVGRNYQDIRTLLREQNRLALSKMTQQAAGGGPKFLLSNFDHVPPKEGLLNSFYLDGHFFSNEFLFDMAIGKPLKAVVSFNKEEMQKQWGPVHDDLIGIIYELMKNTDDWARTDQNNKPLNPSTRGLFMKLHRMPRASFQTIFSKNQSIKNYFSAPNFQSFESHQIHVLEISVFDTGIGFVRRNLDYEGGLEAKEQVDIIRGCLTKNFTSAGGLEKHYKGLGLHRIMTILNKKGLFWLRTEEVSVFRNLTSELFTDQERDLDVKLFDFFKNTDQEFNKLSKAVGSVITLIYPLSKI